MFNKTKTLTALAAAATLGLAAIATPQPAGAHGGAIAAGIIGGSRSRSHHRLGRPRTVLRLRPRLLRPAPVYYGGGCYWTRQRVWDGWGWRFTRVRVCD